MNGAPLETLWGGRRSARWVEGGREGGCRLSPNRCWSKAKPKDNIEAKIFINIDDKENNHKSLQSNQIKYCNCNLHPLSCTKAKNILRIYPKAKTFILRIIINFFADFHRAYFFKSIV